MQIYAFYNILFTRFLLTRFLPEQNRPHQSLALLEVKSKILDDIIFRLCVCGRVQRIDGVLGVARRSGVCVGMRVVLRCGGYFTVSHQVCRHSDRDASRLQIGTVGMPEAVGGQVLGDDASDDFVPVNFRSVFTIHLPFKTPPERFKTTVIQLTACQLFNH